MIMPKALAMWILIPILEVKEIIAVKGHYITYNSANEATKMRVQRVQSSSDNIFNRALVFVMVCSRSCIEDYLPYVAYKMKHLETRYDALHAELRAHAGSSSIPPRLIIFYLPPPGGPSIYLYISLIIKH